MFLGIDLGTSSIKLVLIDQDQNIVSESSQALTICQPKPLHSEQNPEDWWKALNQAILHLNHREKIQTIGLSGQMHGAVLLDRSHEVLRPAILWNDGRSFQECSILEKRVPHFQEIIGTRIMPGFTAPKLLWIQKHEPKIFASIDKILLPKDYLRMKMSGDFATDMSDASGTCWLDVGKRKWSEEMIHACQISSKHLPTVYEGTEITSELSTECSKRWGLLNRAKIVAGGGDNASSAISMGITQSGRAFLSLGTSGVYFVSFDAFLPNISDGVHTFCHCIPNLWHQMSVHLASAINLSWIKSVLQIDSYEEMMKMAEDGPTKLLFLPYLSGIRTPYNDPYAKGAFFGLTGSTTNKEMIRAVLEGVAFDFADGQDALLKAGFIQDVSVVGGGSRNPFWGKILATILKQKLTYRANAEMGGALGAARLAWFSEQPKKDPVQLLLPPKILEVIEPSKEDTSKKRALFKHLYQHLKPCFQEEL